MSKNIYVSQLLFHESKSLQNISFTYFIACYLFLVFLLMSFPHVTIAMELHNNDTNLMSRNVGKSCNLFKGSWVYDTTYPLYAPSSCPYIRKEFDCIKNGRSDSLYLKYRWQPTNCNMPRFDGKKFLKRFRGKKIMFIGDSLSSNFYTSLICLLHTADPRSIITFHSTHLMTTTNFQDYEVQVIKFSSSYLVDIEKEKIGQVLKLNSMKNGKIWKKMDVLIFHTWDWWDHRKPFDYIQDGNNIFKDMNRLRAFHKALMTWSKWIESDIDSTKTKVFFQGVTPTHYNGRDWNEPSVMNCANETTPLNGSTYPNTLGSVLTIINDVLSTTRKPVEFLDLWALSGLRKDGHPSKHNGGMDCRHWCVPGLPDVWGQLFYALIIKN